MLYKNSLYLSSFFFLLTFSFSLAQNPVDKTVYLIGDTGEMPEELSDGMKALQTHFKDNSTDNTVLVFLGDNVYPDGFPTEKGSWQDRAKKILDHHFEVLENYDGETYFLSGNHDWRKEKVKRIDNQKDYIEDNSNAEWMPKVSCGLDGEDLSDEVYLITIDSQWLLEDWDKSPLVNKKCDQIKTRAQFYEEFETELKKNQNKTVIVTMHHPLLDYGVHGGVIPPRKHLFPISKPIPLPGLATVLALARSAGVSAQDINNKAYQDMKNRLVTITNRWNKVVFASGHEHALQYIEREGIKQIVSGSGSKQSFIKAKAGTKFKAPKQGFAQLDIYKNGKTNLKFYTADHAKPQLAYEEEIFPKEESFDINQIDQNYPQYVETSIYDKSEFPKAKKSKFLGDTYQDYYTTNIKAKVALLDTLYGGLIPMRKGGGVATKSLRLKDSKGREYNIRAIKKNASQILQTTIFQDLFIGDLYDDTAIEDFIKKVLTGSHPFGFLAVPKLAEAIDVYHTNPEIFYIPKQPVLGDFNASYGDEIYMIEERPEEHWLGAEFFGSPNHDVESSDDVYEKLARDEKYSIDEEQYIRTRVFDMLIGDFDRHADQWRWAEDEYENGNHVFKAIPRDRDMAFADFDSKFFSSLKLFSAFPKRYTEYKENIQYPNEFHFNALPLDRTLLRNSTREDWLKQVEFIQNNLTSEIVDNAFDQLPKEIQGEKTETLKTILLKRKDNLKT